MIYFCYLNVTWRLTFTLNLLYHIWKKLEFCQKKNLFGIKNLYKFSMSCSIILEMCKVHWDYVLFIGEKYTRHCLKMRSFIPDTQYWTGRRTIAQTVRGSYSIQYWKPLYIHGWTGSINLLIYLRPCLYMSVIIFYLQYRRTIKNFWRKKITCFV